ncbi:hypothetical protein GWK47_046504 [Chionoecetes opilio]|nr:hypothetical protein GWK47_046504 [Chionoecetes opilio]
MVSLPPASPLPLTTTQRGRIECVVHHAQEMVKKSRKLNWTVDETLLLVNLIQERRKGKNGRFTLLLGIPKIRPVTWRHIARCLNDAFPRVVRNTTQCENRWYSVLYRTRKKLLSIDKVCPQSGADGLTAIPLDLVETVISDILGWKNYKAVEDIPAVSNEDVTLTVTQ